MPSMDAIVGYWTDQDPIWSKSYYIGWGEPFCFACGWLAPVDDTRRDAWRVAGKWLDRAHLEDRFFGGEDKPHNLVPMCHLCHQDMPDSDSRDYGLSWVQNRAACDWGFQVFTDDRLRGVTPTRGTTLTRARMRYLELLSAANQLVHAGGAADA